MKILGIETSCDETAVAVVEDGSRLLSNTVASSMDLHAAYGGVVPEIAARSHIEAMIPTVDKALSDANTNWGEIDAIATTYGPGLGGSLLIGVLTARSLSITKGKPLYAVNHVEAHCYASFITSTSLPGYSISSSTPEFPLLALIVSGGHTQLAYFRDHFDYDLLGQTNDDAVGEAFDKVAKIIGLPYPGGPSIEKASGHGNAEAYQLPKAKTEEIFDFSYSGLKTAVLRLAQAEIGKDHTFPSHQIADKLSERQKNDIAACFQKTALSMLVDKTELAINRLNPQCLIVAGGVAASINLKQLLSNRLALPIHYPDPKLCTDNGAMVATCGSYMHSLKSNQADPYKLDIAPGLSM